MNVIYAWTPFFTDTAGDNPPGRLIAGIVIHDTEGHAKVDPRQEGSWHYEIDRDGAIYQSIDEADIAWHVRACDRWWPDWLPHWGNYDVSRMNEWSIGIELVSDATYRAAGESYTDAQYTALAALIRDLFARRGVLPIVGHGQVQADRSDPVAFDWDQLTDLLKTAEDDMAKLSEDQRQQLDLLASWDITTAAALRDWKTWSDQTALDVEAQRTEIANLTERLTNAPLRTDSDIAAVRVVRRNGAEQLVN
jgi:N-acetyl-anhydromuramyl-L-alanine amidase AmpD